MPADPRAPEAYIALSIVEFERGEAAGSPDAPTLTPAQQADADARLHAAIDQVLADRAARATREDPDR